MVNFSAVLASVVGGLCSGQQAVPPPPDQIAANSFAPTDASDRLVYADPAMRALDSRMVALWTAAGMSFRVAVLFRFEPQQAWVHRRSLCAFSERLAACLRAAYGDRIELLSALALAAMVPAHGRPVPRLSAGLRSSPAPTGGSAGPGAVFD